MLIFPLFFIGELLDAVELIVSPEATLLALFCSSFSILVAPFLCGEGKYDRLLLAMDEGSG